MNNKSHDIMELQNDDNVTVIIKTISQKLEFTSSVIDKDEDNVYIKPVYVDRKILNLESPKVTIDTVWQKENGSPVIWHNCDIKIVRPEQKSSRYVIIPAEAGFTYNRRRHYRIPVRLHGETKLDGYPKVRDIIVRDVSISGCCIELDEDIENYKNLSLHLTFNDEHLNYHFDLTANILRKEKKGTNKFYYGCQFEKPYMQIGHYLNLKQQEEILSNPETSTPSKMKYFEMIKSVRKVIR